MAEHAVGEDAAELMALDYKISRWTRDEEKNTVIVRIYRGDITTEQEPDLYGKIVDVTRYRRTELVGERKLSFDCKISPEELGKLLNEKIDSISVDAKEVVADFQKTTEEAKIDVAKLAITKLSEVVILDRLSVDKIQDDAL